MIHIDATVTSGRGIATKERASDVLQISKEHNIPLINGSLNLTSKKPLWLEPEHAIFQKDGHAYWPAWIEGVPILINRWSGLCPVHVFEVFAGEMLREKFNLNDGDTVTISLPQKYQSLKRGVSLRDRLVWYAVWRGREQHIYRDGRYLRLIRIGNLRQYIWRSLQKP